MAMVHIVTLVTGEYEDTNRQVIGAYLDEEKAVARARELEAILELCALDRTSTRARIMAGGPDAPEGMEESAALLAGLDSIYVSYNGVGVFIDSIRLLG